MIPDAFIQDILAKVDIVDVVGRYVSLRNGGSNLIGLCPFHNEKTPSFTVSPSKQFYHCFGCGAHGSAITFVIEHTGVSFPEAVHSLAASVGMVVPEAQVSARYRIEAVQRKEAQSRHNQVLEMAQALYAKQLSTAVPAIQYLKQRGLTGKIARHFGLGWSGSDKQGLIQAFSCYEDPILVEAGLVIEAEDGRRYDRFRDRITFPIRNPKGKLIGFGGRILGKGEPKYLNSPETPIFIKGQELYGLWEARQSIRAENQVIVVEGYMDVVGLAQLGIGHAVATLGTAISPDQVKKLLRASHRIVFSFDGDQAGRRAAWRALQVCLPLLRDDITLRFLFLPPEHDPDSYVRAFGVQAFRACLAEATALSRFFLNELSARHILTEAEGRASCMYEAKSLIAAIPQCGLRTQIERELGKLVHLTPQEVTEILAQEVSGMSSLGSTAMGGAASVAFMHAGSRNRVQGGGKQLGSSFQVGQGVQVGSSFQAGQGGQVGSSFQAGQGGQVGSSFQAGQSNQVGSSFQTAQARQSDQTSQEAMATEYLGMDARRLRRLDNKDALAMRRPVPTLARRLLRLLAAHPELADSMGDLQLEVLDRVGALNLDLVCNLILLIKSSGAQDFGALLTAAEPESDLELALRSMRADLLREEDLPDPQAEWDDALHRIEFLTIKEEMNELIRSGLEKPEALMRYQELSKQLAALKHVGSSAIG